MQRERLTTGIARLLQRVPWVIRWARRVGLADLHIPHGEAGVHKVGHRRYVGHLWDELGELQFQMMLDEGLEPSHYFCDVACGSFRAGRYFIRYLEPGHYLGIDKERALVELGSRHELGPDLLAEKRPEIIVDPDFRFDRFSARASFALAHSLFTHLPISLIEVCLRNLRSWIRPDGVFLATFFESDRPVHNPDRPHDHARFEYTRAQMEGLGRIAGWVPEYLGEWNHPRGQKLIRFRAGQGARDETGDS